MQDVDLGMVSAGCETIDSAIDRFSDVKTKMIEAFTLLDQNHLRFGDINSSLSSQLEELADQTIKCSVMDEGVTATIRANAQRQHEQYLAWLAAQREQNNDTKKA